MGKFILGLAGIAVVVLAGCVNVTVPEEPIRVYSGSSAPRVDSRRVPKPTTLSECQSDLNSAYAYIQSLERRNQKLEADKAEQKRKIKDLERRLKRYED